MSPLHVSLIYIVQGSSRVTTEDERGSDASSIAIDLSDQEDLDMGEGELPTSTPNQDVEVQSAYIIFRLRLIVCR